MNPLLDPLTSDDELTEADLDTVVHALQFLRQKIDAELLDPLLDHREAYLARRERSDAVDAVVTKVRRLREDIRRM
ncbi:MAG: hypothetical protein AAGI91_10045 [Bacteroidota bacterium]